MLSGTAYLLCTNPRVLRELTERVRGDFTQNRTLNLVNLQQRQFLNAVLLECLRLCLQPQTVFAGEPQYRRPYHGEVHSLSGLCDDESKGRQLLYAEFSPPERNDSGKVGETLSSGVSDQRQRYHEAV
ncbi:uncharacterized protein P174DRAFT_117179 [Aspergillus novofumigatus IBT 16806]|uniref:Cytochrome P450 n=1 Tax=Aspergillus novofumigatus (strain IBT 16806) TaxID=1392255 RepID=A0A2I1CJG6_ASPN1|nr:uncharacterized protein P174DRAFT_117179 [Aspergillus novofumigatus IBT 16806]PKX97772.1 hypothetical protein P174DRAFT_117179 [Aspergillus novofumigatus IBT 16806]